jgi:hypothetical protein
MEANQHAWHSTLHTATDRDGAAVGYGGGGPGWSGPRDWPQKDYGPRGRCVDTEHVFRVSVSFPVDSKGVLKAMDVKLEQPGKPCNMELSLNKYEGMKEMTEAFEAGMTPIISYWAADDMVWMDGAGDDMQGPCIKDAAKKCGEKVSMFDFQVTSLKMGYKSPVLKKPKTTTPPPAVQKAIKKELASMAAAQQKELATQQKEQAGDQQQKELAAQQMELAALQKELAAQQKELASMLAGTPVEDGAQSSATFTPYEEAEADVDYLFQKNAALGSILRNASLSGGVMATTLVAGAAVLAAAVASLAACRRRSEAWRSTSSGFDALVAPEASPQRARSLLLPAPSSQSLLVLSAEEA